MSFKYKMHLSFCFDAGTTNTSGLELLMNMFGGLGPGAGVPNNPDGYMPSSLCQLIPEYPFAIEICIPNFPSVKHFYGSMSCSATRGTICNTAIPATRNGFLGHSSKHSGFECHFWKCPCGSWLALKEYWWIDSLHVCFAIFPLAHNYNDGFNFIILQGIIIYTFRVV